MAKGKVYLIGAGPGNPDLITVRGLSLIPQADCILYDHLVPTELLSLAKPGAEIISVAKSAGKHTLPQPDISELIIKLAKKQKTVVRLKGGDPYLFGRGAEEALACADAGIDFEVIPGVTSPIAAAAYAGIPATHRDYTSSLAIVTGHRKTDQPLDIPKAPTIIFIMPVANAPQIIDSLIKAGFSSDTKIAAVENGTLYNQRVIISTLNDFVKTVESKKLKPPAIFIVGRIVELHKKLNWFGKKPNILVLGNHPEKYRHLGNIVHRQIIDCIPLDDYHKVDNFLKDLTSFDYCIFTSPFAVKFLFKRLETLSLDSRALAGIKIAAIGNTTAEKLKEFGITTDICPQNQSTEGLLEEFKKLNLTGKKIFLPRSDIAPPDFADELTKMHVDVSSIPIYRTVEIEPDDIEFEHIQQILFTSASTVQAFVNKFSRLPGHIKAFALGPPTQKEAKKHNIDTEVIR